MHLFATLQTPHHTVNVHTTDAENPLNALFYTCGNFTSTTHNDSAINPDIFDAQPDKKLASLIHDLHHHLHDNELNNDLATNIIYHIP